MNVFFFLGERFDHVLSPTHRPAFAYPPSATKRRHLKANTSFLQQCCTQSAIHPLTHWYIFTLNQIYYRKEKKNHYMVCIGIRMCISSVELSAKCSSY